MICLALAGMISLSGCDGMSEQGRIATGAIGGGALGYITADALGADSDWRLISALAGAAAGTLVARNPRRGRCAYARGDGGYYTRRCR
ncbi:MAG: glycine zipper 2TM domain-containing protein [Roseovarius sp.]